MAIDVVCPGCHKRFKVSDKFAGKKGPCPKCKAEITVPDSAEQVVVHAPEEFGPTDSKGRSVLRPIARQETRFSTVPAVATAAAVLAVLVIAVMLRSYDGDVPLFILVIGSILLAPPLVLGGYTFLRNDELEPYRGQSLWIRVAICSLVYAALWGLYSAGVYYLYEGDPLEVFQLIFIVPPVVALGGLAAYASLDLDFTNAVIHYGLYLGVTVLLRVIMKMSAF